VARYDRVIPPGGEGNITVQLSTIGYQGAVRKSAVVYSNDPKHPQIRLTLLAHVKVPISIRPRGVLLEGFMNDEIQRIVTIRAHGDHPLRLEAGRISLEGKVAYEIETVEEGRVFQVILRNTHKQKDRYRGFLTLKTNYPQKPEITIPFLGYIRGNLQLRPEGINFGLIESAHLRNGIHQGFSPRRSVMVTLFQGNDLKIEKVEINQRLFEVVVKETQPGKSYRIDVSLRPEGLPKGRINERMRIYTNLKDDPVAVIPIQVQIR
jgi:hypothetical protein